MLAQILAVSVFIVMFFLIVTDKFEHHHITLGCAAFVLVFVFGIGMQTHGWQTAHPDIIDPGLHATIGTLNFHSIFTPEFWIGGSEASGGINWETIIFLAGMMVMVEGMGEAGFFRWLCLTLAKAVKYKTIPLFFAFMVMSAVLSMFIDSITVILFLAAVTVELAHLLRFNPIPMIISEIFCANLGGSATMCGDPPNIIIGTALGYSFSDFITNTGVIALVCFAFTVPYFYLCFKKQLKSNVPEGTLYPEPADAIKSKRSFFMSVAIFAIAVVLLVTHSQTHLTVAFIGVVVAILTIITSGKSCLKILKKVDYKTLLFFTGLFVVVGGLERTGILEIIAEYIGVISGGNTILMLAIIIGISAVASAFIDNIPFAATMLPIIKTLSATQGVDLSTLAWTLAIGTDIGGSATPIGASANVVGTSIAAKEGHPISWGTYCKYSAPATIMVIAISLGIIILRYC